MSNYQQLYEKTKLELAEIEAELTDFKGYLFVTFKQNKLYICLFDFRN